MNKSSAYLTAGIAVTVVVAGYFVITKIISSVNTPLPEITLPGFTPVPGFTTSPSQTSSPAPEPTSTTEPEGLILIRNVPFTPQAPLANWADPRQEDGCEEATALMAMSWVQGRQLTLAGAEQDIIAISDYEAKNYGSFYDTSVQDTIDRIYKGYFRYNNVEAKYGITDDDIKTELIKGNLVVVPANGRLLNNPFYKPPGPLRHMLVIRGYDPNTDEFITNDPGTKRGEQYRYSVQTIMDAIYDYKTGHAETVISITKAMIMIRPK